MRRGSGSSRTNPGRDAPGFPATGLSPLCGGFRSGIAGLGRVGGLFGGRRKYVLVGLAAACSCALSCAHGKTGVGRPAQPARGMPRAHAADTPAQPTHPAPDSFLWPAPQEEKEEERKATATAACRPLRAFRYTSSTHGVDPPTVIGKLSEAGRGQLAGPSTAWMPWPSLQGRTCGVSRQLPPSPPTKQQPRAALAFVVAVASAGAGQPPGRSPL